MLIEIIRKSDCIVVVPKSTTFYCNRLASHLRKNISGVSVVSDTSAITIKSYKKGEPLDKIFSSVQSALKQRPLDSKFVNFFRKYIKFSAAKN